MGGGGSAPLYPTVDLSGKVIMVTGGNTGIEYATAKALSIMGAHTIIICRTMEKAIELRYYADLISLRKRTV